MPRKKKEAAPVTEVVESYAEPKSDGTYNPGKNRHGFVLDVNNYLPPDKQDADKKYKFGGAHQSYVARNKSAGWEVARGPDGKPVVVGNMTLLQRPKEVSEQAREFKREEAAKLARRYSAEKIAEQLGEAGFGRESKKWF